MKRVLLLYTLLFISLTLACSRSTPTQNATPTNKPADFQVAKTDDKQSQELQKQIEQIASAAKGRVGVVAVVLEIGESASLNFEERLAVSHNRSEQLAGSPNPDEQLSVSLNPHDHFPMQSVYKLPIGMAVMQQVDAGKIKLDQKVRVAKSDFVRQGQHSPIRDKYPNGAELSVNELLGFAISESDGTASDVLLRLAGGAEVVQAYLNELKINEMVVANSEKEIGQDWQTQYRNWASPEAAVTLLRALHERRGLSEQSQALLLRLLTESTPGAKRLKGLLPAGTVVAIKREPQAPRTASRRPRMT